MSPRPCSVLETFARAASLRELFEIVVGLVRVKINHFTGQPNPYRMNSPTASIAVRGMEFTVSVETAGGTNVIVIEGLVEVSSLSDSTRSVLLESGQGVWVRAGELLGMNDPRRPGRELAQRNPPERARPSPAGNQKPMPGANPDRPSPPNGAPMGRYVEDPRRPPESAGPQELPVPQAPSATAYSRYVAGLFAGSSSLLWRYHAFADAHLDSLENPAYAVGFQSTEARLFLAPAHSAAGNAMFPQGSAFTPVAGFVAGGAFNSSHASLGTFTSAS